MNLNATLFAQMVVFLILAWFTMKFVWPPLINALDERSKKIADGLSAAEKGKQNSKPLTSASTRNLPRHATTVSNVSPTQKSALWQSLTKSRLRHKLKPLASSRKRRPTRTSKS